MACNASNKALTPRRSRPVTYHAAHGSPALTFSQRTSESELGAFGIAAVLMQRHPVVVLELSKVQSCRLEIGREEGHD